MLTTDHQLPSSARVRSSAADAAGSSISLRRLWWAAIVLLGFATGAVRSAISDSGNMAAVLASQLARSLQSIDRVLLEIRKSTAQLDVGEPSEIHGAFNREEMQRSLK